MTAKMRQLKKSRARQKAAALPESNLDKNAVLSVGVDIRDLDRLARLLDEPPPSTHLKALSKPGATGAGLQILNDIEALQRRLDYALSLQRDVAQATSLLHVEESMAGVMQRDIEIAQSLIKEFEKATSAHMEVERIFAFQREFSSLVALQRHTEKSLSFQKELEKALASQNALGDTARLEEERKRQVFLRLRDENYAASLRLEGFDAIADPAVTTLDALRNKYAR